MSDESLKWGPYLAERQWGTVREDYSEDGSAWESFPFEMSASRAYRWGEDGIGGISDDKQLLCFAFAFWNGKDPLLKERLFGLGNPEGNHGEDVKECYYYLDNTPTHSYMKMLYKYPQGEFPYEKLKNHGRGVDEPELELIDTGVFDQDRYFDLFLEYAKADGEDLLIRCSIHNRGPEKATLHVLPTLWLRNTWVWKQKSAPTAINSGKNSLDVTVPDLGAYSLYFEEKPQLLFTDNETNAAKLFDAQNTSRYVKDAFHEAVVRKRKDALNPALKGTKSALHYTVEVPAGGSTEIRLRLANKRIADPFADFDSLIQQRLKEADAYYAQLSKYKNPEAQLIQRQAWAGLLWSKQFYYYIVDDWLKGDEPDSTSTARWQIRNYRWRHFFSQNILSMPDKWEYPWFASWDTAFHSIVMSMLDLTFAKSQLMLLTHDWFMHPNGQIPAYEWNFENVNPPILAWAAWEVYEYEYEKTGVKDRRFLERIFQKFLLSFTWWLNRKDAEEHNVFEGGFLGLDNIGLFDRDFKLPPDVHLVQSDATSWMGMFCLSMSTIALELAEEEPHHEEMAAKFLSHFLFIAEAINTAHPEFPSLWHEEDGFYYDILYSPAQSAHLRVRSLVGIIPLLAVSTLDQRKLDLLKDYREHFQWLLQHRPYLCENVACITKPGKDGCRLLSLVNAQHMHRVLEKILDEDEFLSPYGLRSVSRYHMDNPYSLDLIGPQFKVDYEPAESRQPMFGGNSNWRGPIWFPINYLFIQALRTYDDYFGDTFKVEFPTRSGHLHTLAEVASEISERLIQLFERDEKGNRPVYGDIQKFQKDPHFKDLLLFYEYFNGDNGKGLGASHQTGWTSLVALLIQNREK